MLLNNNFFKCNMNADLLGNKSFTISQEYITYADEISAICDPCIGVIGVYFIYQC